MSDGRRDEGGAGKPPFGTIAAAEAVLTPREYQRLAARTETQQENALQRISGVPTIAPNDCTPNDSADLIPVRALHAAIGLSGEAGELCGALQKWLWYGKPLDVANAKEELGDLCWYLALACNALGFDLGDVMRSNIAKLKARYPDRYTDERAAEENRDRDAERRTIVQDNFGNSYDVSRRQVAKLADGDPPPEPSQPTGENGPLPNPHRESPPKPIGPLAGAKATPDDFKKYVHHRLDEAGVPHSVPGKHLDEGCRIGGRLDWVLSKAGLIVLK